MIRILIVSILLSFLISSCLGFISEYGELTNPEGLAIMTIHKPEICIAKAQKNDIVSYHYIGRLLSDNSIFGRSFDYNTPYITPLGEAKIIAGMDQGLVGTCLGERRRITIPPHLGYGKKGVGDNIPPDSTLVFYIKLLEIERDGISIGSAQTLEAVYNIANRNYEAKNWHNAVNAIDFALNLFREFENKTVECVRQCNNNTLFDDIVEIEEILPSSSINGVGSVKDILPMLQTSKCLQSCRKYSFKSKELEVSYDIIYTFFSKYFYLVLQWAYNQIGDEYNAAVYNQMYYNLYPDVEMAKNNRQYYLRKLGEDYKSVRNRAVTYNTHYYYNSGVEAYNSGHWNVCIEDISLSLHNYKEDWKRCRDFCSAVPVSKASAVVSGYTGIHLAQLQGLVMQCKAECLDKLETVEGVKINNLLGTLFGYIQYCYFRNDKIEEGYIAAITWRALDFSDNSAESAVDYYLKHTDILPMKFNPIEEYIKMKELSEIEARLLTYYLTNEFQKKQGKRGDYTRDINHLKKVSQGRVRDEF